MTQTNTDFINSLIQADATQTALRGFGQEQTTYKYSDIKDLQDYYDSHHPDSILAGLDTSSFSHLLQANDPTGNYSLGLESGVIKNVSNFVHRGFRGLGVNAAGSYIGGGIGSGIDWISGNDENKYYHMGSEIGEGLGRSAVQGAAVIGGIAAAPVTGGASLALTGAGIADAYAQGYTDTGEHKYGLLNATLAGAAPGIGKFGSNVGLRSLSNLSGRSALTSSGFKAGAKRVIATEIGQEAAFFGAEAVGQTLVGENPFTYENMMANVIGNISMAPVTIKGMVGSAKPFTSTPSNVFDGVWSEAYLNKKRLTDDDVPRPVNQGDEKILGLPAPKEIKTKINDLGNDGTVIEAGMTPERVALYNTIVRANNNFIDKYVTDSNSKKALLDLSENAFGLKDAIISASDLTRPITSMDDVVNINLVYNKLVSELTESVKKTYTSKLDHSRLLNQLNQAKDKKVALLESLEGTTNSVRKQRVKKSIKKLEKTIEATESKLKEITDKLKTESSELRKLKSLELGSDIKQDFNDRVKETSHFRDFNELKGSNVGEGRRVPKSVKRVPTGQRSQQSRFRLVGSEEVYSMFNENLDNGDNPAEAVIRTGQQLQGMTKDLVRTGGELPADKTAQIVSVLGRTFDYMGISNVLKGLWMGKALDVIERLPLDPRTKFLPLDEYSPELSGKAKEHLLGIYSNDDQFKIGINTEQFNSTKGLDAFQAVSTLVHESIHGVIHKLDNDLDLGLENKRVTALRDAREYAKTLSEEQRYEIISRFYDEMIPKELRSKDEVRGGNIEGWKRYASSDPEEFLTEFASLVALSGEAPGVSKEQRTSKLKVAFRHLPEPLKNFMRAVFKTANELTNMVKSVLPRDQHKKFDKFTQDVYTILKPDSEELKAKQALSDVTKPIELDNSNIGLSGAKFRKTGIEKIDKFLEQETEYKEPGTFFRKFGSLQQMAHTPKFLQNLPTMRQVIDVLTRSGGSARTKINAMLRDEMVELDNGILTHLSQVNDKKLNKDQIFRKNARVQYQENQNLRVGLSNAMRQLNDMVSDGVTDVKFETPEVQAHLKGLSIEERKVARELFNSRLKGSMEAAGLIKLGFAEETTLLTAQIFQKSGTDNEQSENLARLAVNSMLKGDPLPAVVSGHEAGVLVAQFLDAQSDATKKTFSSLDKPFFSEMRMGKFNLRVDRKDGKKPVLYTANNKAELKALEKQFEEKKWDVISNTKQKDFEFNELDVVRTNSLQKLINLSEQRITAFEKLTGDTVSSEFRLGANSVVSGLREELKNRKSFLAERKFAEGREYLDMLTTQDGYYNVVAASVTKRVGRARINFLLSSPEWNKSPKLKQELRQFSSRLLDKNQRSFTTFNKMTTVSKMGFNVSSAVVDSTQNLTMGIPILAADTTIPKATEYVAQGYKEAFLPDKDLNPEFKEVLTKLKNQGHLVTGATFEEAFNPNDINAYNVLRAAEGKTLVSTKEALTNRQFMWYKTMDLVKRWGQNFGNMSLIPTKVSAQVGNKTSAYAAYRIGKDKGLSGDKLYDYVLSKTQAINIQGGRAAGSAIKMTDNNTFNAVIESGTLLTKFPVAYLSSMVGNFQSALKSSGLDAETRKKSAKIFTTQLGTALAFSGAMGGIGLGIVSAVVKLVTGFNMEEGLQENLAELTNPTMSDILMNGLLNQTGIDFASRFKIGGIAGVSDYDGFESKDIFHAGGSFIESLFMAPKQIKDGQFSKIDIIPPGLRKLHTAFADEGKVYDKSGKLVMDLDGTENLIYALGFRPTALTQKQKQLSLLKDISERDSRERQREHVKYSDQVLNGNFAEVKPIIEKRIQPELEQYANSGMSPGDIQKMRDRLYKAEARKFINSALDRVYETDVFDRGSGATAQQRARLQSTFGKHRTPRALVAQREQKEMELLSQMTGKPIDRRSKTIRMFRMIDRLILENPSLTRGQARAIAQQQLAGSARYGSTLEQDFR